MQRVIIVNAYPLRFSGALQILMQFIQSVERYSLKSDKYYIFIDSSLSLTTEADNIEFVTVKQNAIAKRLFLYNFLGLKSYLKKKHIIADKIISLANVNTSLGKDTEEYVYFHQSLVIYRYRYNFFKRSEFSLWVYKYYYKWIIQRSLTSKTNVIVQLDCIAKRFSDIFKIDENHILKITPSIAIPFISHLETDIDIDSNAINCIYPATPIKYKNHKVLFEALDSIPNNTPNKIKLYLTCSQSDINYDIPKHHNVEIVFLGHISFDVLMSLYKQMDALLFPSYVESFGLPMIEAATTGIKIIASDTDFANEVLKDYNGVTYVPSFDSDKWINAILAINKNERYAPYLISSDSSWKILFNQINKSK